MREDYVGIWKQRDPPERDYIITLRRHITTDGLATQTIAVDEGGNWAICGYMSNDTGMAAAIISIEGHYLHALSAPEFSELDKPIISSQDFCKQYTHTLLSSLQLHGITYVTKAALTD